jgi:hypothetical protein
MTTFKNSAPEMKKSMSLYNIGSSMYNVACSTLLFLWKGMIDTTSVSVDMCNAISLPEDIDPCQPSKDFDCNKDGDNMTFTMDEMKTIVSKASSLMEKNKATEAVSVPSKPKNKKKNKKNSRKQKSSTAMSSDRVGKSQTMSSEDIPFAGYTVPVVEEKQTVENIEKPNQDGHIISSSISRKTAHKEDVKYEHSALRKMGIRPRIPNEVFKIQPMRQPKPPSTEGNGFNLEYQRSRRALQ